MNLSNLRPPQGQKQKRQRIGQGMGTGRGKYSGRGAKGARSISGYSMMRGFEGGQMPLHRRLPKRGFTKFSGRNTPSSMSAAWSSWRAMLSIPAGLMELGVIKKLGAGFKVLGSGELTRKADRAGARILKIGSGENPEGWRKRRSNRKRSHDAR